MKRLKMASRRRPTIRKIASKILRVMRLRQHYIGSLSIQVRACTNLPIAVGEHRVDAYVIIQVVDRYGKIDTAHSKRKTLTVFNTCNPEFEEVFVYDFKTADDLDGYIRCTVVDYNASKTSTEIGLTTIPLSTWIKEGIVNEKVFAKTEWHKLQRPEKSGKTGYLKSKSTGKGSKILISVSTTSSGVEDNQVAMARAGQNSVSRCAPPPSKNLCTAIIAPRHYIRRCVQILIDGAPSNKSRICSKYTKPHEAYKPFTRIEVDHLDTNNASAPCFDQVADFVVLIK